MAGKTGKAAILWRASLLALIVAVLVITGYQVKLNRYSMPRVLGTSNRCEKQVHKYLARLTVVGRNVEKKDSLKLPAIR